MIHRFMRQRTRIEYFCQKTRRRQAKVFVSYIKHGPQGQIVSVLDAKEYQAFKKANPGRVISEEEDSLSVRLKRFQEENREFLTAIENGRLTRFIIELEGESNDEH